MGDKSAIEWTDATWNPTVGCSIVSPGCTNCYAMKVANGLERRFDSEKYRGLTKIVNRNAVWTGEVRLNEAALLQPLKCKRGRRIFVNSMSDLFHEALSDADIDRVFAVMALCPQHTFQVLTKRAERMREYLSRKDAALRWVKEACRIGKIDSPYDFVSPDTAADWQGDGLPNVWLGISAERQQEADVRIPHLLNSPAAVRFVSVEPLLGRISFRWAKWEEWFKDAKGNPRPTCDHLEGLRRLDWIIVGGESGAKARPMHPQWARDIRDQCVEAGVPFFFKQWGEWHLTPASNGDETWPAPWPKERGQPQRGDIAHMERVGKKAAGRLLDGIEHNGFPEVRT